MPYNNYHSFFRLCLKAGLPDMGKCSFVASYEQFLFS